MTHIPEEAYAAARKAADAALTEEPELVRPPYLVMRRLPPAVVEAVWPLAVQAGRNEAAEEIRRVTHVWAEQAALIVKRGGSTAAARIAAEGRGE